jgi:predicted nucleotidyltransferase
MTNPVPESLLRQIVATYNPRRVILFGSHARGEAGPGSDLDLMVVLDDDAPAELRHWSKKFEARRDYDGAVDILTCRDSTLQEKARSPWSFAASVLNEGITIYER